MNHNFPNNSIDLVIFNLNDILLETSIVLEGALRNALLDFFPNINFGHHHYLNNNYNVPASIKLYKLKQETKLPSNLMKKIDWAYEEYAKDAIQYMSLSDNVIECLDFIGVSGYKIVVVSNTRPELLDHMIETTGLDEFIHYYKSTKESDIHNIIPDTSIIDHVKRRFRKSKQKVVYVDNNSLGEYMAEQSEIYYMGLSEQESINIDMFKHWG